jgi:hypothetical protein
MMFRPAFRFLTGPRPPGLLAARLFAAVIRPPLLFFAMVSFLSLVRSPHPSPGGLTASLGARWRIVPLFPRAKALSSGTSGFTVQSVPSESAPDLSRVHEPPTGSDIGSIGPGARPDTLRMSVGPGPMGRGNSLDRCRALARGMPTPSPYFERPSWR